MNSRVTKKKILKNLLKDYPQLTREDILAALKYARDLVINERTFPMIKKK